MKMMNPLVLLSFGLFTLNVKGDYCNWSSCSGVPQGCCDESALLFCNDNGNQCENSCGGQWCSGSFSYCTWSTCDGVLGSTEWCNAEQTNCEGACGGMWCTNGGSGSNPTGPAPTGSSPTNPPQPVPTGTSPTNPPSSGTATTTRYWDCSGGACGCAYLPFGPGTDGQPAHCHSNAMFSAPANNEYGATFYGTAAVSQELFGYNTQWLGAGCGTCYKLTGTGNIAGQPQVDTTIVLKAVNLCPPQNPACAGSNVHFDIAAPGFDVTAYSFAHTCPEREAAEQDGFSACEFWMINSLDPTQNCDCSKFDSPVLEAGCNNFLSLNWDNPTVQYESVACPEELTRLNCWEDNGSQYPSGIPEFCESNVVDGLQFPPTAAPISTSPPTKAPISTSPPTKAPITTSPPTKAPITTSPPTKAPITTSPPTKAPITTSPPTKAPITTSPPTKAPISTSPPTKAPVLAPTGGGSYCCSSNYKDCNVSGWCGAKQDRCENNCGGSWIEAGSCPAGIPRWGACTNDINGCCSPGTCQGDQYYRQCL